MNGIIDILFITIVTVMIGGVLVLLFKALEQYFVRFIQLSFYYRFLCIILLLYTVPILFALFRLVCHIYGHPVTALFGIATQMICLIFLLLAVIWLIGMIVQSVKQIKGIKLLHKIYRQRVPASYHYQVLLDELREEMGIHRHIPVYQSYHAKTVFISGLLRPAIYLPMEEIDVSVLKVIFTHELKHYKQGDISLKLISVVLYVVYWFWPPFAYVCKEYSIYAEANNDRFCSEKFGDGREYYYLLVDFADISGNDMSMIVPAWVEEKCEIARRLRLVNTCKSKKTNLCFVALFVAFALATCSVTAYGATSVMQYGYNQAWNVTMVGEQEELTSVSELQEYEGSVSDFDDFTLVEEAEQEVMGRSGEHLFSTRLMNQCYYRSPLITKSSGGSIRVCVDVTPSNKEVTVGIVKPNGTTVYVKGTGAIAHTFSITTTGNHQVFISNYSGSVVTIAGYYR